MTANIRTEEYLYKTYVKRFFLLANIYLNHEILAKFMNTWFITFIYSLLNDCSWIISRTQNYSMWTFLPTLGFGKGYSPGSIMKLPVLSYLWDLIGIERLANLTTFYHGYFSAVKIYLLRSFANCFTCIKGYIDHPLYSQQYDIACF